MLKKRLSLIFTGCLMLVGCSNTESTQVENTTAAMTTKVPVEIVASGTDYANTDDDENMEINKLSLSFGDSEAFTINLYENETATTIAEYVGTASWQLPIYHFDDYENWEVMQYYDIPSQYEIPSSPESITSQTAGTVYYSEPNRIILFYQDAEIPAEYTPVGYIDYSDNFLEAVENNPVVKGWSNKLIHISIGN